jgi:hypothetical protein
VSSMRLLIVSSFVGPAAGISLRGACSVLVTRGPAEEPHRAPPPPRAVPGWALREGVYLVGSGSTGVAPTFGTLGLLYCAVMVGGAYAFRLPAPGWHPSAAIGSQWVQNPRHGDPIANQKQTHKVAAPPATTADDSEDAEAGRGSAAKAAAAAEGSPPSVHVDVIHRTPQFWLLLSATAGNAVAGVIILSGAKLMMAETFGSTMPAYVDAAFCASFVSALSIANMSGRLGWAAVRCCCMSQLRSRAAAFRSRTSRFHGRVTSV